MFLFIFYCYIITFQLLGAVEQLKTKLEMLEHELHDEKVELVELRKEVQSIKAEIFDLKKEDQSMKTENQKLNVQVAVLQTQQAHQMSEEFGFSYLCLQSLSVRNKLKIL